MVDIAASSSESQGAPRRSAHGNLDRAVRTVGEQKRAWSRLPIGDRIRILDRLAHDMSRMASAWVRVSRQVKGLESGSIYDGEDWLSGPLIVQRNIRLLREALIDIRDRGVPGIPGEVRTRDDGRVVAGVFPSSGYDRIMFRGFEAEVWMEPGVCAENLSEHQARFHRDPHDGRVALVLGAGNVSAIGPTDALYKLFVEGRVVVLKMNPVLDPLAPVIERAFQELIRPGYLRVVHGGAVEGAYLCRHPGVDEIHITGSERTHDAIVFGAGEDGARRRREGRRLLNKPVTSELGNVSPVIVVPGPWTDADLAFHGMNLANMQTNNAGFNCNAARVIVQHSGWDGRERLLEALGRALASLPTREAYYPGAFDVHSRFTAAYPQVRTYGRSATGELPWTLIPGVDPTEAGQPAFQTEAFCALTSETGLEAADPAQFVDRAAAFVDTHLHGSLNATLLVHPRSMKDPALAAAVERAVASLRFGTVAINHWPAVSYGLVATPWGAFPGNTPEEPGSGIGVVHNTAMFERSQKTVLRGPFRPPVTPLWFPSHRHGPVLARRVAQFEAAPSPTGLLGLAWPALRG